MSKFGKIGRFVRFQLVSSSWVALHPEPKGIIQLIGGAFFGSFPTVSYRHLLRKFFEEGYALAVYPFRLSFRHWSIAIKLINEQAVVQAAIIQRAKQLGYSSEIYQDRSNYFWLGHSLGCKYIALLEAFSDEEGKKAIQNFPNVSQSGAIALRDNIPSIKGQPAILLAPFISNTESVIPIPLANFLDRVGLGVMPTREQMQGLIERSRLFNLTALVSFTSDRVSGSKADRYRDEKTRNNSTVLWLIEQLQHKPLPLLYQEMPGKHLKPVGLAGYSQGNYLVTFDPCAQLSEPIQSRPLEEVVTQLLEKLKQRQNNSESVVP